MRISDWSSDVCSSDLLCRLKSLPVAEPARIKPHIPTAIVKCHAINRLRQPSAHRETHRRRCLLASSHTADDGPQLIDRKSVVEGQSVSVRVDLGGRRIIKKKKKKQNQKKI